MSAWMDSKSQKMWISNEEEIEQLIRELLFHIKPTKITDLSVKHMIDVLQTVNELSNSSVMTSTDWDNACGKSNWRDRLDYIKGKGIEWKPKTPTEKTAGITEIWQKEIVDLLRKGIAKHCLAPLQSDLPWGIITKEKMPKVKEELEKIDGHTIGARNFMIGENLLDWFDEIDTDVVIAYMSGWKKGGGDPRPPRGLIPFARMILGNEIPVFTIMTGPAHRFNEANPEERVDEWDEVLTKNGRSNLSKKSGYWRPLFRCSNAILFSHEQASFHREDFVRGIVLGDE